MKRGCRTFQYVLPFVFVWVGLLSYLRVYLYVSCAWCFSSFVRFLRDKIRLIVLLILEIYNVQSQVEIENKSAKASQWTMWWNTKPQMLGQGAQTSSAVLSASVLVLSGVDMGFQVFAPPLKLVARVSPTDIWQNALWVPSWNLFDRPCVCHRHFKSLLASSTLYSQCHTTKHILSWRLRRRCLCFPTQDFRTPSPKTK